jgi:2-phospho-L-lactate guanylyltransferase
VIVPDRHGDGTNALVVPTGGEFDFRYGPGSSDAHRHEATRLGLTWRLVQRADVALDLDTIDDLRAAGLDAASLPSSD